MVNSPYQLVSQISEPSTVTERVDSSEKKNVAFGLFFGSLKIISSIHSQVTKVFFSWGFMDSMVSWCWSLFSPKTYPKASRFLSGFTPLGGDLPTFLYPWRIHGTEGKICLRLSHKNQRKNVGKYTMHGSYGILKQGEFHCFPGVYILHCWTYFRWWKSGIAIKRRPFRGSVLFEWKSTHCWIVWEKTSSMKIMGHSTFEELKRLICYLVGGFNPSEKY